MYISDLFWNDTFITLEHWRRYKQVECNFLEYVSLKQKVYHLHTNRQKRKWHHFYQLC